MGSSKFDVKSSAPRAAVFLSYAREDADAARRIAEALRSQGVEVWFDEAELRGGDAWDAKIKKQIRECALFMAVVSANTQERAEGYFRREWKLAVERTADMAAGTAFLVPVVIDDTPEVEALVPEEFMRVQWTRLPGALPTPAFVAQVKSLLAPRRRPSLAPMDAKLTAAPMRTRPPMTALPPLPPKPPVVAAPEPALVKKKPRRSRTGLWLGLLLLLGGAGAWVFFLNPGEPPPPPPKRTVAAPKPTLPAATTPAPVPSAEPAIVDKSIAVLAFENMSPDKDDAYFADGIHEDILTNLANIGDLKVKSRTSVLQYRGSKLSLRQIATELGAAYVLEGSVRRAGDKLRITGQLIDARTDEHVWAKSYDRDFKDVLAVQSELATEIANALKAALSPQEKARLARRPTASPAAYELYLKSLAGTGSYENTRVLLESAVQLDPNFALAWGRLGRTIYEIDNRRRDLSGLQRQKAQQAIDTMERLAPDDPDTLLQLVRYYSRTGGFARSEAYLARVAQMLPMNGDVAQLLGDVEKRHRRFAEALAQYRRAYEFDPQSPVIRVTLATWLKDLRKYDDSEKVMRDFDPEGAAALLAFFARGTIREIKAPVTVSSDDPGAIRRSYAWATGAAAEYIRLQEEVRQRNGAGAVSTNDETQITLARLSLGDTARAKADAARFVAAHQGDSTRLLGLNLAILGDKKAALENMDRFIADTTKNGVDLDLANYGFGPASILAWCGEKGKATAELARLFKLPAVNVNVHVLRHCPLWQPLQGYPPFEALLADPKNNAPLL